MGKWLLTIVLFFIIGCQTPYVVHEDLELVRNSLVIQKQITDHLMDNVVPQNDRQVRAIAEMRLEIEQRFERMAAATNRLILYFQADKEVEFITHVFNIMSNSGLKRLLGDVSTGKEESNDKTLVTIDDSIVYGEHDVWMLSSSKSD